MTTWCGGVGAAWAERRTNIDLEGGRSLEAAGLWVPINSNGHPVRVRESFFDVYGQFAKSRKVSGRVTVPPVARAGDASSVAASSRRFRHPRARQ